jgi:hypothetical protein
MRQHSTSLTEIASFKYWAESGLHNSRQARHEVSSTFVETSHERSKNGIEMRDHQWLKSRTSRFTNCETGVLSLTSVCFVWIWEQTAIISLYNINWLVCITETEYVYCAVRTGSLYTASLTFRNCTFCPHSVFMCFVWIWEQSAIISLYSINWLVCITDMESVYCAVRSGSLNIVQAEFSPVHRRDTWGNPLRLTKTMHSRNKRLNINDLSTQLDVQYIHRRTYVQSLKATQNASVLYHK